LHGRGTIAFTGKVLCRVEIPNYQPGTLKRHGCPSHGIALTPDEKELWVVDGADATAMPPRYAASIKLRDFPGWISFSDRDRVRSRQGYPRGKPVWCRRPAMTARAADGARGR